MSKKQAVLLILDGYGLNEKTEANAVAIAKTPVMDKLMKEYPFVKGNASGMAVGLPDGQMGNSEVGHLNMGAGRIVYQELTRITKEIMDGDFFKNEELLAAVENCKKNDSALHLYGLLSDGGVHSHNTHLYALLKLAKECGLSKVYVHCFLDGRDTPPASGKDFVAALEKEMAEIGVGEVASISGRYYAMDRDKNWDRVEKAYAAGVPVVACNMAGAGELVEKAKCGLTFLNNDAQITREPEPLPATFFTGQPQLMSMKSGWRCSTTSKHRNNSSSSAPKIWIPIGCCASSNCILRKLFSASRLSASEAINSVIKTSTPKRLQICRKGISVTSSIGERPRRQYFSGNNVIIVKS